MNRAFTKLAIASVTSLVSMSAAAVDIQQGSYTFTQENSPNQAEEINSGVLGGATFNITSGDRTGNISFPDAVIGGALDDQVGFLYNMMESETGTRAVNLPYGGNIGGALERRGVRVGWATGTVGGGGMALTTPVLPNGTGPDFVIFESGDSGQPDAMMVRVRVANDPGGAYYTDWFYQAPVEETTGSPVLFAYEYDLTDMGLSATDQIDQIEIANMVGDDRIDAVGALIGPADPMDAKWVAGQIGGALDLDGADDFGTFMSALFDVGTAGTLNFWTNMDDTGTRNQFFEGPGNAGMEFQYRSNSGGQFYGRGNNGGDFTIESGGAGVLHNGNWVNMQYTWDSTVSEMRIYRNGVEVGYLGGFDQNLAGWPPVTDTTAGTMYFGTDPGSGRYVNGRVDDIGFFDGVLDQTDRDNIRNNGVAALSADGRLVAHWDLDTVSGNTEADNANGIILTINNNEPWAAEGNVEPEVNNPYAMDNPGPDPGPLGASYMIPYGNSTRDPDPLYVAALHDLVEIEVLLPPTDITVNKTFSDGANFSVDVQLVCTSGDIAPMATLSIDPMNPGVWTVTNADPGTECTATEMTGTPGYVPEDAACEDMAIEQQTECTITNTARVTTFVVEKTYDDARMTPVDVELNCGGINTSIDDNTLTAAPGSPAMFTVRTYEPGDLCTATETVPAGYIWDNPTDCENVDVETPGTCTLENLARVATFSVTKTYSDAWTDPVDVTLTCGGVNTTIDDNTLTAAPGSPADFTVRTYEPGDLCTAVEVQPLGYTWTNPGDCADVDIETPGTCDLFNQLNEDSFTVMKDFTDDNPNPVEVALTCSTGTVTNTPQNASEGSPAIFNVIRYEPGSTCEATEVVPDGYDADLSDCQDGDEVGEGCTIVNSVTVEVVFRVTKDFSDDNPANVMVAIECNTGLPLYQEAEVSEFGNPFDVIDFIVEDYAGGDLSCTITELVPDGYESSYQASPGLPGQAGDIDSDESGCYFTEVVGGTFFCEITNDLLPVEVVINKEWIDDNPDFAYPLWVEARLFCNAFIEENCRGSDDFAGCRGASEGVTSSIDFYMDPDNPGVFHVLPDWDGSTYCYVTEEIQSGTEADVSDCANIPLAPGQDGECTIVNTRLYEGIPTLNQYGMLLMILLMMGVGAAVITRRV